MTGNNPVAVGPDGLNNINIKTNNATVTFFGNAGTNTLTEDFGLSNLILGSNAASLSSGLGNVGLGDGVLNAITSGSSNTAVGVDVLQNITTQSANTAIGFNSMDTASSATNNTALGYATLSGASTANSNIAIGYQSILNATNPNNNIAIGISAGSAWTGSEANNLILYNAGVLGDTNTIRIGTQGPGAAQQNKCFIAGIIGVSPANPQTVGIDSVTGQLGVIAGAGPSIEMITGNDGVPEIPALGNFNFLTSNATVKFLGSAATETLNFGLTNLVLGSSLPSLAGGTSNVGFGQTVLNALTSGDENTAIGTVALEFLTSASGNTAIGAFAGNKITTSPSNTAVGEGALQSLTTGTGRNISIGFNSLANLLTGASNTCIGYQAGINYVAAETGNILLNNPGVAAESNITRIGVQGTQTACFIAGITGVAPSNPQTVGIDSVTGQLGIIAGSGPAIIKITGNTGGAEVPDGSGNFNFLTTNATVKFVGSANTETIDFGITNLVLGSSLSALAGGTLNVGVGTGVLTAITSGFENIAMGASSGGGLTTGNTNVALGHAALWNPKTCTDNIAIGATTLQDVNCGSANAAIGTNALGGLGGCGSFNVAIGFKAGFSYNTTTESSNITIGYNNLGTATESNVLRIGNATGAGNGNLAKAFICGIDGVNVGSVAKVLTMASNQLGTATITAGTGVSIVPTANTITVNAVGGGVTWTVIAANQTAAVNNGYFCNKAGTLALALPAVSAVGDVIEAANINTALGLQFTQAAGQQIFFSTASTTLGATGTLTSTAIGDTVKLVCRVANTTWQAVAGIGNFTPA